MNKTLAFTLAALAATPLLAVQGTIHTEADKKSGDIKWSPRSKSYELTYKKGKTDVSAVFKLDEVTKLDIPRPAALEKAAELIDKGQAAAAITPLKKLAEEYRMLVWDKPAGRYLALAYLQSGQAKKALDACEDILKDDKSAAWSGDLAPAYWQALLKLGRGEKLEGLLAKAASSGDRRASAAALVMRGDIVLDGGDSPDQCRKALTDGYLRVILMYTDAACRDERVEALLKAAACFDKLGQASRAENLRAEAKGA